MNLVVTEQKGIECMIPFPGSRITSAAFEIDQGWWEVLPRQQELTSGCSRYTCLES